MMNKPKLSYGANGFNSMKLHEPTSQAVKAYDLHIILLLLKYPTLKLEE